MRGVWAERRAAGVPAEMVKLVAELRHDGLADALPVGGRFGINIHDEQRVIEFATGRVEGGDEGVFFFDAGHVDTAVELSCRMVRSAVDAMLQSAKSPSQTQSLRKQAGR